jgi:hypothetical protein
MRRVRVQASQLLGSPLRLCLVYLDSPVHSLQGRSAAFCVES